MTQTLRGRQGSGPDPPSWHGGAQCEPKSEGVIGRLTGTLIGTLRIGSWQSGGIPKAWIS